MKTLLGIRTVYDIDQTKTFRIADIIEAGAILPCSVKLSDLMVTDLQEQCVCLEYAGDDPKCPVHGQPISELDGSDTSTMTQLQDAGYGSQGVF